MTKTNYNTIKDLIYNLIIKCYCIFKDRKYGYFGNYASWEAAVNNSSGYNSDLILDKVKNALLKVKNGEATYERDSVLFNKIQYSWPLLASLLYVAAVNNSKLRVLDFGGSLGSTYFQNRKFFSDLDEVLWCIIEQEKFVKTGKEYFECEQLSFYYDIDSCIKEVNPQVAVLSAVIQYLKNPYDFLEELIKKEVEFIIIDRTPLIEKYEDIITVQKVPPFIYEASYPAWFFNRNNFLAILCQDYEIIEEFDTLADKIYIKNTNLVAHDKGFFLKRRKHS